MAQIFRMSASMPLVAAYGSGCTGIDPCGPGDRLIPAHRRDAAPFCTTIPKGTLTIASTTTAARGLGTAAGVALYVSAVIGPGILTLPATAARIAGPLSLVAIAILLAVSVPAAFAFVFIHRAASGNGGDSAGSIQSYVSAAFGPLAGRLVSAWFFLGVPLGVPALALIGGSYVSAAIGGGRTTTLAAAWLIATIAVATSIAGGRSSATLSLVLTGSLMLLIVGAAAASAPHWRPAGIGELAPNGAGSILPALLVLMWVLTGWEASTNFASMLRPPSARLSRVIALTLIIVVVLYACVAMPEILVLGPYAGSTEAPVAEVLRAAVGPAASAVAAVLAALLSLANASAYLISLRRLGRHFLADVAPQPPTRDHRLAVGIPAFLTAVGLTLATVEPIDTGWFVAVCAGSQVPVYLVALSSGLRLLPRRSCGWWLSFVATVAVALLLIPTGPFLLAPLAISAGFLLVGALNRRRQARETLT
ncbi:MAG TPA: amino acid permease [Sinomonas sp.]|nr:amino acid permease [Sinomonas sp.]